VVICVTSSLNASALEPDEAFRKLYGRRLQCVKAKVTAKWSIKKFSDGETYALDMSPEHGQATITFNDEVPMWKLEMDYDTALNSRFLKSGSMKNKRLQKDDFILAVELESDRYLFNPFYGGRFLYTWPSSIRPPRVNYKVMYPPIHPRAVGLVSLQNSLIVVSPKALAWMREWSEKTSTKYSQTKTGFRLVGPTSQIQQAEYDYFDAVNPILTLSWTLGKMAVNEGFVPAAEPWCVQKTEHKRFGEAILPVRARQTQTEYKQTFNEATREPVSVLVRTEFVLELAWEYVNDDKLSLSDDYQAWNLPLGTRVLDVSTDEPRTVDRITVVPVTQKKSVSRIGLTLVLSALVATILYFSYRYLGRLRRYRRLEME